MIEEIKRAIGELIGDEVELEIPRSDFGDFALTPGVVSKLSQKQGVSSEELAGKIEGELRRRLPDKIGSVKFESGYINIKLATGAYLDELNKIEENIDGYLVNPENLGKTVIFDYSSPNIAKPFSVGNLRSTVIGQANYNIHRALGYKTVGINHIGDWGTQFGKLIYAIKTWGDESEIAENPIEELNNLYVKFHEEAAKNPQIEGSAREWFRKLEGGDPEAHEIWQKCIDWSFEEFERVYKILGIKIDEVKGESFYKDKLESVIKELQEKNLLKESEGAQIVELEKMPPALIRKSDGATLYITRDLAALKYRIESYHPVKIVYHIGNDQSLHFRQLEAVAKQLGWLENMEIVFAGHGMMRLPEGKMSTRLGRVILLEDLVEEAKKRSLQIIEEKNPELHDKEKVAEAIGVSAIKYADLMSNRKSDVIFSPDRVISLQGNSGPYLQYTYARSSAVIREFKKKYPQGKSEPYLDELVFDLAKLIIRLKPVLRSSASFSAPNILCELIYNICNEFNTFYEKKRIVTDSSDESSKLIYIVEVTNKVLAKIFDLLGLAKLEKI